MSCFLCKSNPRIYTLFALLVSTSFTWIFNQLFDLRYSFKRRRRRTCIFGRAYLAFRPIKTRGAVRKHFRGAKGIHNTSHNTITDTRTQNLFQVQSRGLEAGAVVAHFNLASLQRGKRKRGGGVNISTGQRFIFRFQGPSKDTFIFTFRFLSISQFPPKAPNDNNHYGTTQV